MKENVLKVRLGIHDYKLSLLADELSHSFAIFWAFRDFPIINLILYLVLFIISPLIWSI
mgnify:CR=1 FL=1